jgi:Domain of unknown function (DUF5069)
MQTIPAPREKMADCVWLPRIIAKTRLLHAGELPTAYADRFCHPTGVDGQFIKFFNLTKTDIIAVANRPDSSIQDWFLSLDGIDEKRIEEWNELAENLGRPGFPMADRLQVGLATTYSHLKPDQARTIFDLLDLDEGRSPKSA